MYNHSNIICVQSYIQIDSIDVVMFMFHKIRNKQTNTHGVKLKQSIGQNVSLL